MHIDCPACKKPIGLKGVKPGQFRLNCQKCEEAFWLVVLASAETAPSGSRPGLPAVATSGSGARPGLAAPTTRIPARSAAEATGDFSPPHDPHATGDFSEPPPARPARKPAPQPVGEATGDFSPDGERTLDLVRNAPRSAPPVGEATGDFGPSAVDGERTLDLVRNAPRSAAPVGEATGDFSADGERTLDLVRNAPTPGEATGDFTEQADPPSRAEATGDFTPGPAVAAQGKSRVTRVAPAGAAAAGEGTGDFSMDSDGGGKDDDEPAPAAGGDDDVPARLGGYEVLKVLGKGGMGAVLLGRQVSLNRKVALKVMHPRIARDPVFVARFTREAYAAAQLTHHNVVQVYDIGEDHGQHFFSMEFVAGQSLRDLVRKEGKLAPEAAVGYTLQAARGLRYGHQQGMVHRDIKPDNLMLNPEGIVKVADMGLVKLPSGDLPATAGTVPKVDDEGEAEGDSSELTRAGAVMGTPAYMAPEQANDSSKVDGRADIYSLGCSLYVLLTGKPPFDGKTALEIISKHVTAPIVPPEAVVKRVPKALSAILLKMLAKAPADRQQSMDEVISELEGFLGTDKGGTFTPKDQHADLLEEAVKEFQGASKGGMKRSLALGFFGACVLGVVGAAFAGMPILAGGVLGLMLTAPVAYFVVHGTLTGSVVFTRARALVLGMKITDWAMGVAGAALFLVTLYLFGLLWAWLGFLAVGVGLGFALWWLTDRPQAAAQADPVSNAKVLFKQLRGQGLEEDALRQFVCKFGGEDWEPFFEALFGYEAKLAARAARKGHTGEPSNTHGAWREPVVAWIDARLEERRRAKEERHLQKVEVKALQSEGVSAAEAQQRAAEMAAALVDQAAAADVARKKGEAVNVRAMVAAARRRRPPEGYNIAGVKMRSQWGRKLLNGWLGPKMRLVTGAALFAVGLLWLNQNGLLAKTNPAVQALMSFDFAGAAKALGPAATVPPAVSFLPAQILAPFNGYAAPVCGFLVLLTGILFHGWKPTIPALLGAGFAVFGPSLGVPDAGPVGAHLLCLLVGVVLILGVGWFVRR